MILDIPNISDLDESIISNHPFSDTYQVAYVTGSDLNTFTEPVNTKRGMISERIFSLMFLKENWDGDGAFNIDFKVFQNSKKFINALSDNILDVLNEEEITPTQYGTIVFEWENKNGCISVEIGATEIGYFYEIDEKIIVGKPEKFNENSIPKEIVSTIQKVFYS